MGGPNRIIEHPVSPSGGTLSRAESATTWKFRDRVTAVDDDC